MDALTSLLRCADPLKLTVLEQRAQLQDSVGKSKAAKEKCEKMLRMIGESSFWRRVEEITSYLLPIKVLAKKAIGSTGPDGNGMETGTAGHASRQAHAYSQCSVLSGREASTAESKLWGGPSRNSYAYMYSQCYAMHDAR